MMKDSVQNQTTMEKHYVLRKHLEMDGAATPIGCSIIASCEALMRPVSRRMSVIFKIKNSLKICI